MNKTCDVSVYYNKVYRLFTPNSRRFWHHLGSILPSEQALPAQRAGYTCPNTECHVVLPRESGIWSHRVMEWLPRKNSKCAKQHPAVAYVNKNYSLMVFFCQRVYIKSMYRGKQIWRIRVWCYKKAILKTMFYC